MLIFNFHHVEKEILHPDRKHITITPEGLRRFIRTLRAVGMEIISVRDILAKDDSAADSGRQVLLTFDDGYVNNYEYAVPVLEEEKCPATIFVLPGRFSGTNEWDQGHLSEDTRDQLMSVDQMQRLCGSKYVTFGSHGMRHRDFTKLSPEDLQYEIHESHRILSETLGDAYLPVLAYPWGNCSPEVVAAMQDSPYRYAFTVETAQWQNGQPRFEIPRYSVYYRDGNPVIFLAKLARHRLLFA